MKKNISQLLDNQTFDEKILQFGTGVLLRGLPDFLIDKANKKGIFNGSIVVVKSTDGGELDAFRVQNNAYTICTRGVENGNIIDESTICTSISRVLSAKSEWNDILACAKNPAMNIVISNTTEMGLKLEADDDIFSASPHSFPAKLLSFLHARYVHFEGSSDAGMCIVPTELVTDNALILKQLLNELATKQNLDEAFVAWLNSANLFCNSLVDRIVPGKPSSETLAELSEKLGYEDHLLSVAEPYLLWAIEGDEKVKNILSFANADPRIIIATDINRFRELKLRLLNGTHTLCCGLAHLSGFKSVREAMQNADFEHFTRQMMIEELIPNIPFAVEKQEAEAFANAVLDRFRNPYVEHLWLNITFAYTSKMEMRCLPMMINAIKKDGKMPPLMAKGFAAYCRFMQATTKDEQGKYYGFCNDATYLIQDPKAAIFYEKDKNWTPEYLYNLLTDNNLWQKSFAEYLDEPTLKKVSEQIFECQV